MTRPSEGMRKAMAEAAVGDDVWGDDPTVNSLQERAAALFGKEAALFLPSSTMGNLISVLCHCPRGRGCIVGDKCHINKYEAGGMAQLGGVFPLLVPNQPDGSLDLAAVAAAVGNPEDPHSVHAAALCLESTHNMMGGAVLPLGYIEEARALADKCGLKLHLDGARLLNAEVASGVPAKTIAQHFDSVNLCLSKGLGCPMGALLLGSKEFIKRALFERKRLGGGMRQVGIVAAAGHYALDRYAEQLAKDHANMRHLYDSLAKLPEQVAFLQAACPTNILYFQLTPAAKLTGAQLAHKLEEQHAIKVNLRDDGAIRVVTHLDVSQADVERLAAAITAELAN